MPFAKNHSCFYNKDHLGELPAGEPHPSFPRPRTEGSGYRVPRTRPLALYPQDREAGKFVSWPHTQASLI